VQIAKDSKVDFFFAVDNKLFQFTKNERRKKNLHPFFRMQLLY